MPFETAKPIPFKSDNKGENLHISKAKIERPRMAAAEEYKVELPKLEKAQIKMLKDMPVSQVTKPEDVYISDIEEIVLAPEEIIEVKEEPPKIPEAAREAVEKASIVKIREQINAERKRLKVNHPQIEEKEIRIESGELEDTDFEATFIGYTEQKDSSEGHPMNQDNCFFDAKTGTLCVCDGATLSETEGHQSSMVVADGIHKRLSKAKIGDLLDADYLRSVVFEANNESAERAPGSNTTVSLVKTINQLPNGKLQVAAVWVGDSPIYVRRENGEVKKISQDHNQLNLVRNEPETMDRVAPFVTKRVFGKKHANNEKLIGEVAQAIDLVKDFNELDQIRQLPVDAKSMQKLIGIFQSLQSTITGAAGVRLKGRTAELTRKIEQSFKDKIDVKYLELDDGDDIFVASDGLSDNRKVEQIQKSLTGDLEDYERVIKEVVADKSPDKKEDDNAIVVMQVRLKQNRKKVAKAA